MKMYLIYFISLFNFWTESGNDIITVRTLYYRAASDKNMSDSLYSYLSSVPDINKNLLNGYIGMSFMIQANYAINPISKLNYFNNGKMMLNKAIDSDQNNIELRFLRFSVQTNAPAFLNYKDAIETDKKIILNGYNKILDTDLKKRIKTYMISSNYCTVYEKSKFK